MAREPTRVFRPQKTGGTSLAVTNSSDRVELPGGRPTEVRLRTKPTDSDCFVEFGDSTVTAATATGLSLGAGSVEFIRIPINATYVAAITASGTATLYIHSGEGG